MLNSGGTMFKVNIPIREAFEKKLLMHNDLCYLGKIWSDFNENIGD